MTAIFQSGKTGAIALVAPNATQYTIPSGSNRIGIMRGNANVPLINASAYEANRVIGAAWADVQINVPIIPGITTASFFNQMLGLAWASGSPDDNTINYWTVTSWPAAEATAQVYGSVKWMGMSIGVAFAETGMPQMARCILSGRCYDPLSTVASAATPPTWGTPISNTGVLGFFQSGFGSGPTADYVTAISLNISTDLRNAPSAVAGNNSNYPYLINGGTYFDEVGSVVLTQAEGATITPGLDNSIDSLIFSLGGTGAGIKFTMSVAPQGNSLPHSTNDFNYITSTYSLIDTSGVAPVVIADL